MAFCGGLGGFGGLGALGGFGGLGAMGGLGGLGCAPACGPCAQPVPVPVRVRNQKNTSFNFTLSNYFLNNNKKHTKGASSTTISSFCPLSSTSSSKFATL